MTKPIAINKLCEQVGLTSRTLRHWESEDLFKSVRDPDSGWRAYDDNAILCIQITTLLRKLDIPIKDIKKVLDERTFTAIHEVITKRISLIATQREENQLKEYELRQLLSYLMGKGKEVLLDTSLSKLLDCVTTDYSSSNEREDTFMLNSEIDSMNVRFITLYPMRVAYNIAISVSPEEEAIKPVVDWLRAADLLGVSRLFGGDVKPMPSGEGKPYGYGFCASIPDGVIVPPHLKEMTLPGGLYAMAESSDDIYGSWQALIKYLTNNPEYEMDHKSRLCLEEHIRNDNVEGSGNQYLLNLLEPVRKK